MKCGIVYFSQTGGTHTIAQTIAQGIRSSGATCDLIPLRNVNTSTLVEYDLIGVGFPVFYYQMPLNITEFIAGLPFQKRALWFAFCTHGSVMGVTLQAAINRLRERDARVIGYFHAYSDGWIPYCPCPTLTAGHPDEIDKNEAVVFGERMATTWARAQAGDDVPDANPDPLPSEERWILGELDLYQPGALKGMLPPLFVNAAKCTQCGKCMRECPVDGIDTGSSPARIQSPCIFCFRCAMVCPTGAIGGDYGMAMTLMPSSMNRYQRCLKAVIDTGRFVYHMDNTKINYDDPLFVQQERKRGGLAQSYRMNPGLRLLRYAVYRWGMREALMWMVRIKLWLSGNWKKRTEFSEFY